MVPPDDAPRPPEFLGSAGRGPGVDEDPTRWPTGRLLSAVARRSERELDERLARFGLSHASMPVLAALAPGPLSQRATAATIGITEQTLSRHLLGLEGQGLVSRRPDRNDLRRRVVELTDRGRETMLAVVADLHRPSALHAALTPEEEATLRAALVKMIRVTEA